MAVQQPESNTALSAASHSKLHKVVAVDTDASDQALTVESNDRVKLLGDIELGSTGVIYIGDPDSNDSYRLKIDSGNFVFEKREGGSWVNKGTILA